MSSCASWRCRCSALPRSATGLPWARIAHLLTGLKAVRYRSESRTIVQRTKVASEFAEMLKKLGISNP